MTLGVRTLGYILAGIMAQHNINDIQHNNTQHLGFSVLILNIFLLIIIKHNVLMSMC
jgi:hypothetical protein